MQVEQLEGLPALVSRLRWQLGFERVVRFALRGLIGTCLSLIALGVLVWLTGAASEMLWLAAAPVAAAIVYGLLHWPSSRDAARAFDKYAGLEDRLATATELLAHPYGRFDTLLLHDAIRSARAAPRGRLVLDAGTRNEALAAAAIGLVAVASIVMSPALPRPVSPTNPPPTLEAPNAASPGALEQRALPLDQVSPSSAAEPTQVASAPAPVVASRVQQEQAEQSALSNLAQALGTLSASQSAADAIQNGQYAAASDALRNLADNSDQLSEAAKQDLARALQQAAASSAQSDQTLANREQQAAKALTRSTYADQRQALQALADQVQRSGSQSAPSDQLARDVGQLEQQQGLQNSPGVGTGVNPNPYSDQPTRLDTSGQKVQVPLQLGSGPGVRPPVASADRTVPDPSLSGANVSQLPQPQQTGRITPEQNLVPGEQRPIVRGYFR